MQSERRTRAFAAHQDAVHELSPHDCAEKDTLQNAKMQAEYKPKGALKQVQVVLQTLQTLQTRAGQVSSSSALPSQKCLSQTLNVDIFELV